MDDLLNRLAESASSEVAAHPPAVIVVRLSLAIAFGWLLGAVYRVTHTGDKFSGAIPQTQVLLALGGALIWLVVGDNIVRAFGLAGTIGLIRYRTRIRDPKDTTVLLFSMILGMACGLGQLIIASIGTAFVVATLLLLSVSHRRRGGGRAGGNGIA